MDKKLLHFGVIGGATVALVLGALVIFPRANNMLGAKGTTTYKHFEAVAPTVTGNGSKEYWSDCVGGAPLFEEPAGATVVDAGAPSAEWVAALDPSDSRYVRPTRDELDMVRNGDNFVLTSFKDSTTSFAYYYFDENVSTAVISVRVPVSLITGGGLQPIGGITISDGSEIGTDRWNNEHTIQYRDSHDYEAFNLGLHTNGLKTYAENYGAKGRAPVADNTAGQKALFWDQNDTNARIDDKDRTLTVIIKDKKFESYIDGRFINTFDPSSTLFMLQAMTGNSYKVGVFIGGSAALNSSVELVSYLKGDDAEAYIRGQVRRNMTRNGNVFTHAVGGTRNPSWMFIDGQYSNTIVAELTFDASLLEKSINPGQIWAGVGFSFTDGATLINEKIMDGTAQDPVDRLGFDSTNDPKQIFVLPTQYGIGMGSKYWSGRTPASWTGHNVQNSDKFDALEYNKTVHNRTVDTDYDTGDPLTTITVTAIYNGGKVHAYLNGHYIAGYGINEGADGAGITYFGLGSQFPANAPLKVAVYMIGYPGGGASATLTKYMVGSAAAAEIATNYVDAQ